MRQAGKVRHLYATFSFPFNAPGNYRGYKEFGGGALLDIGSYCVNAARWLTDLEPQSVQASTSYSHGIDVRTAAILHFDQGITAHIHCSFIAAEHQLIEVVGSTAAVSAPLAFTAWKNDSTELIVQRGSVFERRAFAPADPYEAMLAHFANCVLGNTPLLYPPTDGRETVRVLEMLRSKTH